MSESTLRILSLSIVAYVVTGLGTVSHALDGTIKALRPVPVSELTPEEANRPASEWTLEQIRAKGWTPYSCFQQKRGAGGRAIFGTRWPNNDPDGTRMGTCVTYSFMPAGAALELAEGSNTWPGSMPAGSPGAVTAAAGTWSAVADVHFTLAADGGGPWNGAGTASLRGNIRVGASALLPTVGPLAILAHAYYPWPTGSAAGDVHFNDMFTWSTAPVTPAGAFDVETVALHELGHSLGLTHDCTRPIDAMFPAYNAVKRTPNGVGAACGGVIAACGGFCPGDVAYMTGIYGAAPHVAQCSGACCFGPKICGTRTQTDCGNQGGNFRGPGTQCPTQNVQTVTHSAGPVVHSVDPAFNCFSIVAGQELASRDAVQSNCCVQHLTPGCDTPTCQQVVCQMAPDCCVVQWLPHCVNFALQMCGPLCQPSPTCPATAPIDAWATSNDLMEPTCNQFGNPPIPPGFFGLGSDPFVGTVCYQGEPLGVTPFGDFAVADTVVCRPAGDPFDRCAIPPAQIDIPIEIVALNLVSVEPIIVTFNGGQNSQLWDVRLTLSDVRPPAGSMTVRKTHCNGGTWNSVLPVQAKFTFTRVGNPGDVHVLDTGLQGQPPDMLMVSPGDNVPWVSDLDPYMTLEGRPTDFHGGLVEGNPSTDCDCQPNGQRDLCDIENCPFGDPTCADCNINGVPDECDIASGFSLDGDGDRVPDECDNCPDHPNPDQLDGNRDGIGDLCPPPPPVNPVLAVSPPDQRACRKNRYICFQTNNPGAEVAFEVQRTSAPTMTGYAGPPDTNGVSGVYPTAVFANNWPAVLCVGDCEIPPVHNFEVRVIPGPSPGGATSSALALQTIALPAPKFFGDTTGGLTDKVCSVGGTGCPTVGLTCNVTGTCLLVPNAWDCPNGVVNANDFQMALQKFLGVVTAPHNTMSNIQAVSSTDPCLNTPTNIADVFLILKAFQGLAYPFILGTPGNCPPNTGAMGQCPL